MVIIFINTEYPISNMQVYPSRIHPKPPNPCHFPPGPNCDGPDMERVPTHVPSPHGPNCGGPGMGWDGMVWDGMGEFQRRQFRPWLFLFGAF